MEIMKKISSLSLLLLFSTGCGSIIKTTKKDHVRNGLFNNDPQKLLAAFEQFKDGQTIEEVSQLGFKLDSPNINHALGINAIKMLLGDNVFQSAMTNIMQNPESLKKALAEFAPYQLYTIPYQDITTVSDRFYINRKDTTRDGKNYQIYIAFKDDKVVYRSKSLLEVKESSTEETFLLGLFDLLKEVAGVKSSADEVKPLIPKQK